MEIFTNRAKSFSRLESLAPAWARELQHIYDSQMKTLFSAATKWSVVHGDAHAGNVINTGTGPILFDFDTACRAPSVWDFTHLLNRAGTGGNTGYTEAELRALLPFTAEEIDAAVALRQTASLIAKEYNLIQKLRR